MLASQIFRYKACKAPKRLALRIDDEPVTDTHVSLAQMRLGMDRVLGRTSSLVHEHQHLKHTFSDGSLDLWANECPGKKAELAAYRQKQMLHDFSTSTTS